MSGAHRSEPIEDDEVLYRRVPVSQDWYDPQSDPSLAADAFKPGRHDTTGISVSRAKYKSLEEAARGRPGKSYFVAVLRAGDLRSRGIEVVPRPGENDPGHAELPGLTYETRKTDQASEWRTLLAQELTVRVEGPFAS